MGSHRCLLVGLMVLTACRPSPREEVSQPPPAASAPVAQPAPPPPPPVIVAPSTDVLVRDAARDVAVIANDAPAACVFEGGNARCTRCIVRRCAASLAACCGDARCSAALPALGACLRANPGDESALTGCWDQFNFGGGTSAEPTLRECMERGPCGICEVPR
ncbi:MAG: hypothetical protein U0326_29280 [Polyangiales bacterium]